MDRPLDSRGLWASFEGVCRSGVSRDALALEHTGKSRLMLHMDVRMPRARDAQEGPPVLQGMLITRPPAAAST
jgi:hypothetical protein